VSEGWDAYVCRVNNEPASISLDLGLRRSAPDSERPQLLTIWLWLSTPSSDGLAQESEFPALQEFQNRLQPAVSAAGGTFAGRLTSQRRREFFFYLPSGVTIEAPLREALSSTSYKWDWEVQEDPEWRQYLEFLYPSEADFQLIEDRRVVQALADAGDVHTIPRPVDHWLFFVDAASRDSFAAAARADGFETVATGHHEGPDGDPRPYRLRLSRVDNVALGHIHEVVMGLYNRAAACNGEYDGWETSVQKSDDA
jgi:Family of unknown function (DUF695)/Regulator of ribonuclease activity B